MGLVKVSRGSIPCVSRLAWFLVHSFFCYACCSGSRRDGTGCALCVPPYFSVHGRLYHSPCHAAVESAQAYCYEHCKGGWIFRVKLSFLFADPKLVTDATIAMAGALLLFLIPISLNDNIFVMDWHWASKMSWGVLILFSAALLCPVINELRLILLHAQFSQTVQQVKGRLLVG